MKEQYFYIQTKQIKKITKEKNELLYWFSKKDYLTDEEYIFIHHFICISNALYKKNESMILDDLIKYTIKFVNQHDIMQKIESFYLRNIILRAINCNYIQKIVFNKSETQKLFKEDIPKIFDSLSITTPYKTEITKDGYLLKRMRSKINQNNFLEYIENQINTDKYTYLFFSIIENNPTLINAFNHFLTIGHFVDNLNEKELANIFISKMSENHLNYFIDGGDSK